MDKTVFSFGRLNPPTVGHEKLVNKVKQLAKRHNAEPHVFLSHSQNSKKDPLSYQQKFKYAKQAFGDVVYRSNSRTIIEIMKELEKMNHSEVIMVVGSDRVQEFRALLNKYNGKDYTFKKITVVSAGARDPDAEGVSGMSASKMRAAVAAGDQQTFMQGVPSRLSKQMAARLYTDLRSAMSIREEQEDFDWDLWAETVDIDDVELEELDEAVMTFQQRVKRARTMKRLAPRMKNLRRIKKFRMADKAVLMKRARKQAISLFRKKVAGDKGKQYASLSPAAKITIDKLVQKKLPAIGKLAQRLLPKVRKAEVERLRQARKPANEQLGEGNKAQLGIPANATNAQLRKIRSSDSSTKQQKQRAHWLLNMRKEEDESLDEKCWPGYKEVGGKMKNGKMVPNCVPEDNSSVPQDKDIEDRKGTQPKKYFKDLPKSTKAARDAHFKKHAKKDDSDPANYKPAPGDKSAETKPSKHTKKFKKMFGEDYKTPAADKVNANKTYKRFAALTDLDLNTYNRNLTIDEYSYGPANPDNEKDSEMFWEKKADLWNCSVDQVKTMRCSNCSAFNQTPQVIKMMGNALGPKGSDIIAKANLGYCEFFEFKCAGSRTCDAWVGGGPLKEANGQTDDVQDIVPDRIRISMISSSKKKLLNDKFEKLGEQDSAERTRERQKSERERLKLQHKREKEQQKATHDRQMDRSQIRDIRSENLDDSFETFLDEQMKPRQQKGSSAIAPRSNYALEEKAIDALKKKSEKTGISYSILKKVYDRGMAAWKSGHRPGTTPQQWAFARVNSFATKSKGTWGGADKDLAGQVKGKKESVRVGPYMGKAGVTEQAGRRCPRTKAEQCHCDKLNELNEADEPIKAVCELIHSDKVKGVITLTQSPGQPTIVTGSVTGLAPGKHGFHIHEYGDLSDGCKSAGGHYNPTNVDHGDLVKGHVGDLGNIVANSNGIANINITADRVSLFGEQSVVGRAIVIHEDQDDLGKGGDDESLKTGNAGERLACGVISLTEVQSESISLDESFQKMIQQPSGLGQMITAREAGIKIQGGFALHPSVAEEGGAGEYGTDKLTKKYKKETPGQEEQEDNKDDEV